MQFGEVVRRRRMVRNYTGEPVDEAVLARILDAARRGPSAGFSQGQRFVVVTDPATRRQIAAAARESKYVAAGFEPWLSRAPVHVVVCTRIDDYVDRYREPDKSSLPTGPASAKGSAPPATEWLVPYWYVDAGAALMLVLLAAVDEGLAAGLAGIHSFDGIRELLGIPEDVTPIGVVTIGHPAPDRQSSSLTRGHKPVGEVVFREKWGSTTRGAP